MTMNKKEQLSRLIEIERAKLNRLIDEELSGTEVYRQSRYLDQLIETYMMIQGTKG